jgi:hypothetical protein
MEKGDDTCSKVPEEGAGMLYDVLPLVAAVKVDWLS